MTHGVDYHVGASPRRDWLIDHQRTMASIPKIIGGGSSEVISLMRDLYSPICAEVIEAPDAKHAAMVKVVENYFRYRSILAASELGIMLPDYDVAEILRLASSKWTMNLYHPSFGIGGYCVPLAKDYLGTEPGAREVTLELGRIEEATYSRIRQELSKHGPLGKVAVLGISYMPGMKIHTRSPSLRLIQELKEHGAEVYVHDPLYSPEEVAQKTGGNALNFPSIWRTATPSSSWSVTPATGRSTTRSSSRRCAPRPASSTTSASGPAGTSRAVFSTSKSEAQAISQAIPAPLGTPDYGDVRTTTGTRDGKGD